MQTIVRPAGKLHSMRTRCVASTQGGPSQSEPQWGRSMGHVYGSGLTSFNSCPNPELETVSPLHWRWIRLDLTRLFSHLQQGRLSHAAFQLAILHGLRDLIPRNCQNVYPHCIKPILHEMWDNSSYLATGSSWTFLCWQSWMLLQISSLQIAYKLATEKQRCVMSEKRALSCPNILSSLENATALSRNAENFRPPCLLNSHRLSETLLCNRLNKLPFIGVSLTKQKPQSFLKSTPFSSLGAHGGFFRSDKTLDESEHVQERPRRGSGCLPHTGRPLRPVHQLSEPIQWGHLSKQEKCINLLGCNCA